MVEFYNSSLADRPWRITLGGEQYVSNAAVPLHAERHLLPFVRYVELSQAMAAARAAKP